MRKYNTVLISIFISLILSSAFVFSAGSSTVSDSSSSDSSSDTITTTTSDTDATTERIQSVRERLRENRNEILAAAESGDCDSLETRVERIACRLKRNKNTFEEEVDYEKRIPEACRSGRNPTACIALYKRVQNQGCYSLGGKNKDKCFKNAANITSARLGNIPVAERAEKLRNYMVLLLYELQERIENANKNGKISDEDSAEIIDLIVEIKQDILDGKSRTEILPKLNELKSKIRVHRSGGERE